MSPLDSNEPFRDDQGHVIDNVERRTFWLELPAGERRFLRTWWPKEKAPSAIMCIVPGLGEHTGRYESLASSIAGTGAGVAAIDLQGQGLSPGWRGCVTSYEALLDEVGGLVRLARGGDELQRLAAEEDWQPERRLSLADWPEDRALPVCLYGHSMGGNLVLNAVLRHMARPDRMIASAPMLRAVQPPSPATVRLARMLLKVLPHYRLKAPVRKEYLSHDPSEREAYGSDPLVHRCISLRLGAGLIDSGIWALDNAERLDRPCLLLHGSEDRITAPEASQEFARRAQAAGAPCELVVFPGMLHDLHRDEGREQVIERIAHWLHAWPFSSAAGR
jgi:alpha-beta hydrolase superfamily lysophospholipase